MCVVLQTQFRWNHIHFHMTKTLMAAFPWKLSSLSPVEYDSSSTLEDRDMGHLMNFLFIRPQMRLSSSMLLPFCGMQSSWRPSVTWTWQHDSNSKGCSGNAAVKASSYRGGRHFFSSGLAKWKTHQGPTSIWLPLLIGCYETPLYLKMNQRSRVNPKLSLMNKSSGFFFISVCFSAWTINSNIFNSFKHAISRKVTNENPKLHSRTAVVGFNCSLFATSSLTNQQVTLGFVAVLILLWGISTVHYNITLLYITVL